jgi:tetratricopeptide (TPR) repeat protein
MSWARQRWFRKTKLALTNVSRRLSRNTRAYGGTAHEIGGDALVAEFSRASDAVCAALAFQAENAGHKAELDDEILPEIRVGISLGEFIVADGSVTVNKNYADAVTLLKRRIRRYPETDISRALLASCCGHLGRDDEAREAWAELFEIHPSYSLDKKARLFPYKNPADWDRFVEGLRKAGLPV